MAGLSALSGMSADQIKRLNTQFPAGATGQLSLGGGAQPLWTMQPGARSANGQSYAAYRGGGGSSGYGVQGADGVMRPAVQPGATQLAEGSTTDALSGSTTGSGTTTNPTSGQQYGLSGAEDALQRGLQGGIAGIEAGVNQATNTLSPYTQGGSGAFDYASALSGALGADAQQAAFSRYTESPEVAYQREQAEKAILRNASATGGLGGGNVLQALQRNAIGLAQQDYGNSFNRLMGLGEMGQGSSNLLAGIQANAGNKVGDYAYGTGGQMAGYRTRAGEQIAGNVQDTTSALSGLINQQGTDLSNIIGQQGSNIANLLAQYGVSDAQSLQSLAALLANIATGSASNVAGVPGMPNTNDEGAAGGIGQIVSAIAAAYGASDIRLKKNVRKIGALPSGTNLYQWEWNSIGLQVAGDSPTIGVIAQEVDPSITTIGDHGYLMVDYARVK